MKTLKKIKKAVIEVGKTIAKKPLEAILITTLLATPIACKKHKKPYINQPPVAQVSINQDYNNIPIFLDGSASADPEDGTNLTYSWTQTSGPELTIENPDSAIASVTSKFSNDYAFQLTVTDSQGLSNTAEIPITTIPDNTNLGVQYSSSQTSDAEIKDHSAFLGLDGNLDNDEKIYIDILVDTKAKYNTIPQEVLNQSMDEIITNEEIRNALIDPNVNLKREVKFDDPTSPYNVPLISDAEMQNRRDDDWDDTTFNGNGYVPASLKSILETDIAALGASPTLAQLITTIQRDVQVWADNNGEFNCLYNSYKMSTAAHHFIDQLGLNATVWNGSAMTRASGTPYYGNFTHEEVFLFNNTTNTLYIVGSTSDDIDLYGNTDGIYFNQSPDYFYTNYTNDQLNTLYLEFVQVVDRAGLKSAKGGVLGALDGSHNLHIREPPRQPMWSYISLTRTSAEKIADTKINHGYNAEMQELIKKLESCRESTLTLSHNLDTTIAPYYADGIKYILGFNGTNFKVWATDMNSYSSIWECTSDDSEYDGF